jgi:hypothetical protein
MEDSLETSICVQFVCLRGREEDWGLSPELWTCKASALPLNNIPALQAPNKTSSDVFDSC